MKIGIVQPEITPGIEAVDQNRARVALAADRLLSEGARLVVLPECASHGYFPASLAMLRELAEPLNGPTVTLWSELAASHKGYVIGGILESTEDGIYNTAVLLGPHGLLGFYRKLHRFSWEQEWLLAGNRLIALDLPDLHIRLGMLICYDLRFTEAVQALALADIDLLVVPATWTSIGKSVLWDRCGYCPQNHLAIGYAYAHQIAVVCANRVGREGEVTFLGASIAVHPGGNVALGPLSAHDAAAAITELDVSSARNKRIGSAGDLSHDRRPECYQLTL